MPRLSVTHDTRANIPRVRFAAIKDSALGKNYELNLVFTSPAKIRKLNKIYRGKDVATDILSFPLSKTQGEIYICPSISRKEARKFERKYNNFIAFLFIHGVVHLKGHDHGATMETIEAKLRRKYKV